MSRAMQRRLAVMTVGLVIAAGWLFTGMMLIRAHTVTDGDFTVPAAVAPAAGPAGESPDELR